jgi:hypothetical protein
MWKKIDVSKQEALVPTFYRQLIGSLMYLVITRPDICFVVNTLNQFMVEPRRAHWTASKHILRYLLSHNLYLFQRKRLREGKLV